MAYLSIGGKSERLAHIAELRAADEEGLSDATSSNTTQATNRTRVVKRLGQAVACSSFLAALALAIFHFRSRVGPGVSWRTGAELIQKSNVIKVNSINDNCETYFRTYQDCSKTNLWGCIHDDGSWGYRCCCVHGWGDYSHDQAETTGVISWDKKPEMCVDTSTPFSLGNAPFKSGPFILQVCKWGDPNKQFHLPRNGYGQIKWASHPHLCMGTRNHLDNNNQLLALHDCATAPQAQTHFKVDAATRKISWAAHPDQCLRSAGDNGGAVMEMKPCSAEDPNQNFDIVEAAKPPVKEDYPRLFCISLMLPFGEEPKLMRGQFIRQIGIFECNDYAIYSNVTWNFRNGERSVSTDIMPGSLAVKFGGKWHSALNTDIFIRFWNKVTKDVRAWRNHWTVKLDPDCVFFPSRLQQLTRSLWKDGDAKKPVFLNNCHLGMHGPIEVLSRHALGVYSKHGLSCKLGEPYKHKQEDFYLRRCWRMLGIEQVDVYNILFENAFACDERASTRDGRHPCFSKQVSFHPFKTPEQYWECYRRGASQAWAEPLMPLKEVPNKANHHHG